MNDTLFGVIAVVVVVIVFRLGVIDRLWALFGLGKDTSVIESSDFAHSNLLQTLAAGKIDEDYIYNLRTNQAGRVMFHVIMDHDHDTNLHIIAIGSKSGLDSKLQYHTNRHWLESVALEGDFPDHFRMWCSRGKQIEVREVFSPETMSQFVDFCRAYNFELFNDRIYISVAEQARDPLDTTTMVTDITEFIARARQVFDHL